jgi:hypothetical protein
LRKYFPQLLAIVHDARRGAVGEDVGVAMRKYDNVAGNQIDTMHVVLDFAPRPPFAQQVISDEVLGSLPQKSRYFTPRRRAKSPGGGELGVVKQLRPTGSA